jgi:hypothetical protein
LFTAEIILVLRTDLIFHISEAYFIQINVTESTDHEMFYNRSNSIKAPASEGYNVSETRMMSQVGRVREIV